MRAWCLLALAASLVSFVAFMPMADTASAEPEGIAYPGRWIEVNTATGTAYAFDNGEVVYEAKVTVGSGNWPTSKGRFRIFRRVENETMNSSTIGIPNNSSGGYYLTGVLYTQYFFNGASIHYNYWSPPEAFGSATGSHGCVGMTLEDSQFFWNFADIGTPVIVY